MPRLSAVGISGLQAGEDVNGETALWRDPMAKEWLKAGYALRIIEGEDHAS